MTLSGKRIALLAEDNYQELELWYPLLRLREAGARVTVVGAKKGQTHKSKLGYPVKADLGADEVKADDFDAVVVPGGKAPERMRQNPAMVQLVKDAYHQGKPLAAICHAGWMLAAADIARGKRATCYPGIKDDLIAAGAHYLNREVVIDGNLITSRLPEDLPAFLRELIAALERAPVPA